MHGSPPLPRPKLGSRQIAILGAVLVGLVIPMALTTWHTYSLQERAREQAFAIKMDQIAGTLASGLSGPVWNLSPASGRALADSVVRDPDVVSLRVRSLAQGNFLTAGEAPDGPAPRLRSRRADILFDGEKIGDVTVLFDRGRGHAAIDDLWTEIVAALVVQALISIAIVYLLIRVFIRAERGRVMAEVDDTLRASEERFQDMAANVPGVVYQFCIDRQGRRFFPYVSPTIERVIGVRAVDVEGDAGAWIETIHPDDREAFERSMTETHETLDPWTWEGRMVRPDGEVRWVRGTSLPKRLPDGTVLWNGIVLDITDLHDAREDLKRAHSDLERKVAERTRRLSAEIEERRKIEGALATSERRLKAFFHYAPFEMYLKDADGRYEEINETFLRGHDLSAQDAIGRLPRDIYPPAEAAAARRHDLRVLTEKDAVEDEEIAERADGRHHFLTTKFPILDDRGAVMGLGAVATDITAQKRQEAALRRSEERFKDFTETATDWVWETDTEHRLTFVSGRFFRRMGLDVNMILGKSPLEFFTANDAGEVPAIWRRHRADLEARRAFQDFSFSPVHEGRRHHLTISGRPVFDDDGTFTGYRGTGRDVTDETEANQRLRDLSAAIDTMSEPVVVLDDDRIVFTNEAYRQLNAPALDALEVGKSFEDLLKAIAEHGLVADAAGREAEWIDERLAIHRNPFEPFEVKRGDGTWFLVFEGRLPSGGQVVLLTDISSLKATQRELEIARDDAETANRAKSEFLSSMSHELRTPLNSILGFGQLLKDDRDAALTASQHKSIDHIVRAGNLLLELVDEVLELARIESGTINLACAPVMPTEVLHECLDLVRPMAERGDISLSGQWDDNNGIDVDGARLKQIFLNLMSNGVKYNEPGGELSVRCRRVDRDRIRISVADTGLGIPEERQSSLFQPFYRAGRENSGIEGTGIGLTITKRLVEAMGGRIGFESTVGKGSTFWVEFPERTERTGTRDAGTHGEMPADAPARTPGSGAILYIEDNPANIQLMEQIIDRLDDVELITAHNAEFGIELAIDRRPDLILMDINLPGMNGIQARRALSENADTTAIPVIAVSAAAMPADIEKGRETGFEDYITKPFDIPRLVDTIAAHLG